MEMSRKNGIVIEKKQRPGRPALPIRKQDCLLPGNGTASTIGPRIGPIY